MLATAPPATAPALPFAPACPRCGGALDLSPDAARCLRCAEAYTCEAGIWRFLPVERAARFAPFLAQYEVVRAAEGWGRPDPAYYVALPRVPADDSQRAIWRIRERGYRALLAGVVRPLERARGRPLAVLDLGAGNGWLAHRLARRGHRVAAVDLSTDRLDGLGARAWYGDFAPFAAVQADYEHLPCAPNQFDLAIFNASLHYAADCTAALREALRALRADGRLVVLDTPVYRDPTSGARMVRERAARFSHEHGFAEDALACEGYLTLDRLRGLAATLDLRWTTAAPRPDPRPAFHAGLARLRGQREPARFPVLVGRRSSSRPSPRLKPRLEARRGSPRNPPARVGTDPRAQSAQADFVASVSEPLAAVSTAG
ncbi:MAG TPA: class I SAM-dependent methyltransferase, partial [Thermomicrobiales bacterium]|nr:class I SAM-dependent methyltransferase [Thermomicrobiales bacterium]